MVTSAEAKRPEHNQSGCAGRGVVVVHSMRITKLQPDIMETTNGVLHQTRM